ncbi:MAG: NAD-binding protein [Clostridium sp.]|nr:NAD-binding protein [Clostridium sp.]
MRYLILGLGIYGSNLAVDLTEMGHEVIGVDNRQGNVDFLRDKISSVYRIDVTDETALSMLPINNVDLVIVTIGENFGASIKVVAMLKRMQVKHIYARAIDTLHESILQGFNIDRIITPEQRAAQDLSYEMALGSKAITMKIDDDNFVLRSTLPASLQGLKYADIDFQKSYRLRLISVARTIKTKNAIGVARDSVKMANLSDPDLVALAGDVIVCMGPRQAFFSFFRSIAE